MTEDHFTAASLCILFIFGFVCGVLVVVLALS